MGIYQPVQRRRRLATAVGYRSNCTSKLFDESVCQQKSSALNGMFLSCSEISLILRIKTAEKVTLLF